MKSSIWTAAFLLLIIAPTVTIAQPEVGGFSGGGNMRSEAEAVNQALINTVVPLGMGVGAVKLFESNTLKTFGASLAVYGMVVGPSTGNFYANDYLRGGLGALTRLGAAFLLQDATSEVFGSDFAEALNVDNGNNNTPVAIEDTEIIVGGALMVGTIAYNIISAQASVREYNRQMGYSVRMESLRGTGQSVPVLTAQISF